MKRVAKTTVAPPPAVSLRLVQVAFLYCLSLDLDILSICKTDMSSRYKPIGEGCLSASQRMVHRPPQVDENAGNAEGVRSERQGDDVFTTTSFFNLPTHPKTMSPARH